MYTWIPDFPQLFCLQLCEAAVDNLRSPPDVFVVPVTLLPSSAKKTGQIISCLTVHKTPPPKILKKIPIFAGSLLIIFLQGQKSLPSSLPASKDRAKMRFSHSERGKDGDFRFGVYMYYIPPNRTPHFCHWPNRATRSLPGLCPIVAQRFQNFARFLLAEKLIGFQDFPVIAKQRCFNLIV